VAEVWVKDESWRLGLPAFKMLGASNASYRALTSGSATRCAGIPSMSWQAGSRPLARRIVGYRVPETAR